MFKVEEIKELLDILKKQNIVFVSKHLGPDYLTVEERVILQQAGIDPKRFYSESEDIAKLSFHFGLISDAIKQSDVKNLNFRDIRDYLKEGKYIPLTESEEYAVDSIKKQFLGDIKALEGKIFADVNGLISKEEKNNREAYEKVIRDEISAGNLKKKTSKQIAQELKAKTGDWGRNFNRIVDYVMHGAFDEGRAMYYLNKYGEDSLVYKDVYPGACSHCQDLYLTNGIGSEPKVFKLSELRANGNNIGVPTKEWKPVIAATHPHCRCTINYKDDRFDWNPKTKMFDKLKESYRKERKLKRGPIRISVKGKEYLV